MTTMPNTNLELFQSTILLAKHEQNGDLLLSFFC